jgi:hypothetical protein
MLCASNTDCHYNGLTFYRPEIFDEYTRRQYVAKAPLRNPYGTEEEPEHFVDFDVFTKVGGLHDGILSLKIFTKLSI